MPGHPLGIDLPTLLDSPDTQAAKTITALQTIVADLEGLVSVVGLLADGPLDMGGQSILATGGIVLNNAVPAGSPTGAFYRSGSSLYYVDSLGAVRITNGATLNLSVNGGFVGDLAHLGASYNYANNEYTFADDAANLSGLKGSALRLKGGAKFFLVQPDSALAADTTLTVKDMQGAGVALAALYRTGAGAYDLNQPLDNARRVDQDTFLTKLDLAGDLVAGGAVRRTNSITPATFTGGGHSTHDYSPTGLASASRLRLSVNGAGGAGGELLTGIAAQPDGTLLTITNISALGNDYIYLKDENAGSTAANRFANPNGDIQIHPRGSHTVMYDGPLSRWVSVSLNQ